ncbi:dockerin type I domain-containing protein [Paenibacillus ferrarius]|uniref:dockerin type I domain-containing protein n=1 Tax=Paenibacillus ferrarius TaxID=1469647 RepID=UPI003D2DB8C7
MNAFCRRMAGFVVVATLVIGSLALNVTTSFAESWTFIDGGGTDGLNYNASEAGATPRTAVLNGVLYATWSEGSSGVTQIRVKKYDNGAWTSADNGSALNQNAGKNAQNPVLEVYNNELYATWQESGAVYWQIRVKKWNGTSWVSVDGNDASNGINYNNSNNGRNPRMITYNNKLYVMWDEALGSGINQARVKMYNGSTWTFVDGGTASAGMNKDSALAAQLLYPAVYNNKLYVIWSEGSSTIQTRVKMYDGTSWSFVDGNGTVGLNKDTAKWAQNASLAVYNNELYAAWSETSAGQNQIRVKKYNGTSWTFVDGDVATGINYNTSNSAYIPRLTVFGGNLYVVWYEGTPNFRIRVKMYDGSGWSFVDGNSTSGINKTASAGAQYGFPVVFNNALNVIWQETNGTANQIRIAQMGPSNYAPTATNVTFSGDLKEGSTLTGTYTYGDTESDAEGVTTFKWYTATDAAGTGKAVINGAVSDTLTLTSAEANKFIIFEVTPVASAGTLTGTPVTYTGATAVEPNNAPTATNVIFSGALKEGSTLTGTYTYGDTESDAEGVTTFKWYTATDAAGTGKAVINGAVSDTLTLTSAEANKFIIFEVTPVASAGTLTGTPVTYTSASAVEPNAAPTAEEIKITGAWMLNQELTGWYNYLDADGDGEIGTTFKWYTADDASGLNKTVIAGKTEKTLTLKAAQFGKYIIFEVTPKAASGTAAGIPVSSSAFGPVTVLKGDANGDGVITPADALLATKYAQGKITLDDEQKKALDMDGDGDVDAVDAQLILNVYLGKGV